MFLIKVVTDENKTKNPFSPGEQQIFPSLLLCVLLILQANFFQKQRFQKSEHHYLPTFWTLSKKVIVVVENFYEK